MFVSWKKLCKIAQEEAEMWRKIAEDKTERVEELLEQIKDLYNKRADMYDYCCEIKAKLDFVTKQRDYYYSLLENTEGVHVGDVIVKEEE